MRLIRQLAPKAVAIGSLCLWGALAQPPQYPQQQPPQYPQQQPPQEQQDGDAPDPESASRGAARISVMNGDVSVRRGDNGDYVAAAINAPLVVGDRILTGPNSRAEVQFDSANMIRVAPDSEIRLAELGYRRYQIQIARGTATFRVLRASEADVEVSTPQGSIRPKQQGIYRLTVHEDGMSEVTVRAGEVEVFTPRGVETLHAGKTMQMRGTASDPEFQVVSAYGDDDWDRWNANRDRDLQRAASPRYVNRDIYGTEDLDPYGQWVTDPSYGAVWAPRVAVGWAPYQAGRWVWIDYYGWTWVSYDPWGWAPYHYGRWYQSPAYGWCWYPGGIGARHYWRPALVAFVGFGHGGIGVGFGQVGWVPLAPYERFHPWYGRGFSGGRTNVTVVNNVNIYNTYRNARVTNAVTAVDGSGFARGASGRAFTGDIRQASVVRGQLPVTPVRESMRLSERTVRQSSIPRSSENQRFFSSRQAPQSGNFSQPRVSGPGLTRAPQNTPQTAQPAPQNQGGWKRFGEPNGAGYSRSAERSGSDPNSSRGRFGEPAARTAPQAQVDRPASDTRGAWRKFESRPPAGQDSVGRGYSSGGQAPQPQSQPGGSDFRSRTVAPSPSPNTSAPASRQFQPRNTDGGSGYLGGGGQSPRPVQISPPMVRERSSAPRGESSNRSNSGGGGGGGGGRHEGGGSRSDSGQRGGESRGGRGR